MGTYARQFISAVVAMEIGGSNVDVHLLIKLDVNLAQTVWFICVFSDSV